MTAGEPGEPGRPAQGQHGGAGGAGGEGGEGDPKGAGGAGGAGGTGAPGDEMQSRDQVNAIVTARIAGRQWRIIVYIAICITINVLIYFLSSIGVLP